MKKSPILILFFAWLFVGIQTSNAAPLSLSNVPLYLGGSVDPNVMFLLDDSGSMQFETMPDALTNLFSQSCCTNYQMWVYPRVDGIHGSGDYVATRVPSFAPTSIMGLAFRSSLVNTLYYNPAVTYRPWVNANGSAMPNANPAAAPNRPLFTEFGTRNLTIDNTQTVPWMDTRTNGSTNESRTFYPAVYSTYTGPEIADVNAAIDDANSPLWVVGNYTRTEIRSTTPTYSGEGRENRSDCSGGTCTYSQEIQNFANWYSYHRSRIFASRAGIGRAFATQSETMRVGFGTINETTTGVDGVSTGAVINGVRPFAGGNRTAFYDVLYQRPLPAQGTPLRRALDRAGQYFSSTDSRGPWSTTPGVSGGEDLICRQSYTILMSDGAASGGTGAQAATANARANNDGSTSNSTTNVNPDGEDFSYSPVNPFQDDLSNTLADIAMYYWKRDLRTDLVNKVPTNSLDPAYWQHMVTFTVGLGVAGSIEPEDAFAAIGTNTAINWGDPDYGTANCTGAACIARQDDFLHAAVNSRGGFFSAADPDSFAKELTGILSNIADRTSSASSVALNAGSISTDSKVFQARFNSGDWSGQLLAFPVDASNGNLLPVLWDARDLIPTANSRNIITFDGTEGKPFRWSTITDEQRVLLENEATLNYLRGDQSNELSNGGIYRNRNFLLGDIINSAPAFVGAPAQRYRDNWGSGAAENASPYSSFIESNKTRTPVVYVGANDGMLHAFNANTGVEIFSYIPKAVYKDLKDLSDPNYNHRYYVDGSPTVVDAFINGSWRTILVSGLVAGGQGIFALDVTNPNDFSDETTAASRVLWEFTDINDNDMGFTYGEPSIIRLQNGQWAALFSGGYNNTVDNNQDGATNDSSTGNATLYLVNLANGNLIKKFDTQFGSAQDPTGNNRPNGLASPVAIDITGDSIADQIYAGDLFGNLWKIDISGNGPNNWDFAFKQGNTPRPLYKACHGTVCTSDNIQPITTRPQVVRHPAGNGFLVIFGTGKYFEVGDNSSSGEVTQSLYAIWDKAQSSIVPFDRSDLLQQQIIAEVSVSGDDYRVTSDTQINWNEQLGWYIDLISPDALSNFGERQVSNSIIRNGKIIFTTLIPSDNPCEFGGTGWLMELDFASGARLQYSPFDINDDGRFDSADFICIANCELDAEGNPDPDRVDAPVSGKKSQVGIIPTPSIAAEAGGQKEYKYTSGSSGEIEVIVENPGPGFEGRQSWRQLEFNSR